MDDGKAKDKDKVDRAARRDAARDSRVPFEDQRSATTRILGAFDLGCCFLEIIGVLLEVVFW